MLKKQETEQYSSKQLIPLLTAIALFLGLFIGVVATLIAVRVNEPNSSIQNSTSPLVSSDQYYNEAYIQEVIDTIKDKYLYDLPKGEEGITYGIVNGIIDSLNDRYTAFLTPDQKSQYFEDSSGDFEGIGVVLGYDGENTYIESVLHGNPGESAGLMPGDIIITVDEEQVTGYLPQAVAKLIRGEKGTAVYLEVVRGKENPQAMEFNIERGFIDIDNVTWEKLNDNSVLINIVQFSDRSAQDFNNIWDKVVGEIKDQMPGLKNVIVDLRNNPGGYVFSVRYVAEEFLKNGSTILKERTKNSDEKVYRDDRTGIFEDSSVVVLVNGGSASSSEIFAEAIRQNGRGQLVGTETVGKGVEQELITLSDGSLLMLVFQEWLTPNGDHINQDSPVVPDYEVEYTMDNFQNNQDPQLDKALELLGITSD